MSESQIDTKQFDTNWNNLAGNPQTSGKATIDVKAADTSLFYDFEVSCTGENSGRGCNGHLNLKYGFTQAHVTLLGWNRAPKINYWYEVLPHGKIEDYNPGRTLAPKNGTHEAVSALPKEIRGVIMNLIRDAYANCF